MNNLLEWLTQNDLNKPKAHISNCVNLYACIIMYTL